VAARSERQDAARGGQAFASRQETIMVAAATGRDAINTRPDEPTAANGVNGDPLPPVGKRTRLAARCSVSSDSRNVWTSTERSGSLPSARPPVDALTTCPSPIRSRRSWWSPRSHVGLRSSANAGAECCWHTIRATPRLQYDVAPSGREQK
jgi:hypothetical protein